MPKVLFLSVLLVSLTVSCSVDDQETQKLQDQLDAAYEACMNEGIDDLEALEDALNNGGQNLSKPCRTALGKIDFQGVVDSFKFNLAFETPTPGKTRNPFRDQESSWLALTPWNATDNSFYISTGLDTNDPAGIVIEGVDINGNKTALTANVADISSSQLAINYTTDYSGSMLLDDIVAVSGYYQDLHAVLPSGYLGRVDIFSDAVTNKTGFTTTAATINTALQHDTAYTRASTALYDAWSTAITALNGRGEKVRINILTTDGYENSSTATKTALTTAVQASDAFNVIIASGWAEVDTLSTILGSKGILIYKYQIDEAYALAADMQNALGDIDVVTIPGGISGYKKILVSYQGKAKLTLTLP